MLLLSRRNLKPYTKFFTYMEVGFLALSGRESSLVQTFCESCEQLDITHPSVHMTRRFVIQGCPILSCS